MAADLRLDGIADRVASARAARGISLAEVAAHLGITESWAEDLEHFDDDLPQTLSLRQVCALAQLLAVSPRQLVCGKAAPSAASTTSAHEVVTAIQQYLSQNSVTIDQFGEAVGWDVSGAMEDSESILSAWNLNGLQGICEPLRIDWRTVLPF